MKQPLPVYSGVIAAGAALELLAFPVCGALADRLGSEPVIAAGLFLAIIDYGILALAPHVWSVYISQAVHVSVVAVTYGVCAAYAQRLIAGRAGIATASFFASISLAQIGGGAIGASFVGPLGVRALFWVPAMTAAVALSGFIFFDLTPREAWRQNILLRRATGD